jgi:hypothetical protein
MGALATSQDVSGSLGMSESKVKRICREKGVRYDTNRGSYVFLYSEFMEAYTKKFQQCAVKVANRSRSATREKQQKAAAKQAAKK